MTTFFSNINYLRTTLVSILNYLPAIVETKAGNRKLILFVDASNLYHSIKQLNINPNSIDYHKLFSTIAGVEQPVVRFYTAPKRYEQGQKQRAAQQSFFESLKKNPNLTIHLGTLQIIRGTNNLTFKEKGVDVKIAVDLITLAEKDNYDIAILLSGDADLVPAVENVRERGKRVINAYFAKSSGKELRDKSNSAFRINEELLKKYIR